MVACTLGLMKIYPALIDYIGKSSHIQAKNVQVIVKIVSFEFESQ